MKTNEGTLDRLLRILAGAALVALAIVGPKTQLGWLGLIPLLTGLIGYCPIYQIFGLSTCPVSSRSSSGH